jgi:hypothetical protein
MTTGRAGGLPWINYNILYGTSSRCPSFFDANGNLTEGPDFTDMNNIGTRTIQYNADNKPYHVEHTGNGAAMDLLYDGNGVVP